MPIDWRLLIVGGVLVLGVIVLVIVLVFGGGSAARVGVQQVDEGGGHIQNGSVGGPYGSVPGDLRPALDHARQLGRVHDRQPGRRVAGDPQP